MVRQTEPDKPLPLVSEGPLEGVALPAKQPIAGPHIGVTPVSVGKPTFLQKLSAWWKRVA